MTATDWCIVAAIAVSVAHAASAGFFQEAFGIAGLVFGYLLAAWQYHQLAQHFAPYVNSQWFGEITAFLVIFVAVMVAAGIIGRIARWLMKEAGLNFVDRLLGGALGLLRGCLMVAVVLMSMAAFNPNSKWLEGSRAAPYFLVVGRAAVWVAPSELRARFYQGLDLLRQQHRM